MGEWIEGSLGGEVGLTLSLNASYGNVSMLEQLHAVLGAAGLNLETSEGGGSADGAQRVELRGENGHSLVMGAGEMMSRYDALCFECVLICLCLRCVCVCLHGGVGHRVGWVGWVGCLGEAGDGAVTGQQDPQNFIPGRGSISFSCASPCPFP